MQDLIEIDGSMGEGGGQVLRTSLGLSMVTGRGFRMKNIRAGRKKPGLLRQHLTCVNAATRIGMAEASGAKVRSQELTFRPQGIAPGYHEFSVGTAGSTTLVVQAVLPALLAAEEPTTIVVRGGTHNDMAPNFEFLDRVFFHVLRGMGVKVEASIERYGFFPAGGGEIRVTVEPTKELSQLDLIERGEIAERRATFLNAGLDKRIVAREKGVVVDLLPWSLADYRHVEIDDALCPGNAVILEVGDGQVREMVMSLAARNRRAEVVAKQAVRELNGYLKSKAPVGPHLADQLLIPMAMAKGGRFVCRGPTLHTRTNAEVVGIFLDCTFSFETIGERQVLVTCHA